MLDFRNHPLRGSQKSSKFKHFFSYEKTICEKSVFIYKIPLLEGSS